MTSKELSPQEQVPTTETELPNAAEELRQFNQRVFDAIFNPDLTLRPDRPDILLVDGANTQIAAAGLEWLLGELERIVGADALPSVVYIDLGYTFYDQMREVLRDRMKTSDDRYDMVTHSGATTAGQQQLLTSALREGELDGLEAGADELRKTAETILQDPQRNLETRPLHIIHIMDVFFGEDPRLSLKDAFVEGVLPDDVPKHLTEEVIFESYDFWQGELGLPVDGSAYVARHYNRQDDEQGRHLRAWDEAIRSKAISLTRDQYRSLLDETSS